MSKVFHNFGDPDYDKGTENITDKFMLGKTK